MPDRFGLLEGALNRELLERHAEVHGAVLAFVAGTTCVFMGEPGISKTQLPLRLRDYVDGAEVFDCTLDSFTMPEDLFGPHSLPAMEAGRFERLVESTLVTADWALLDEIFNAHKLLDALLRLVNERTFKNGTNTIPVQLRTLFATFNELPQARGSAMLYNRLYDRLLLRFHVQRLKDPDSVERMLALPEPGPVEPLLRWGEVVEAQGAAAEVTVPALVREGMVQVRQQLAHLGVYPSDRRLRHAMKVVQAEAWLEGCAKAEPAHLRVLGDILWHDPKEIPAVRRAVAAITDPVEVDALGLLDAGAEVIEQLDRVGDDDDLNALATELDDKLMKANDEYQALRRAASQGATVRLAEARSLLRLAAYRVKTELFGIEAGPPP